jgi:LysR family transcriptional regulator, transcriptional activator for aaeXAB operon
MDHFSLEGLSWELSVLSKAVAYKNLSGASQNVGISQPQLSRIVSKLESELRGVLLDRGSRRKSGWTPLAFRLAEVYLKSVRGLNNEVQKLLEGSEPRLIHIGTLEGLIPLAIKFGHHILGHTGVLTLDLNVYDLNLLEEKFFKGDLDVIFTAREPGRKKYQYSKHLGYQSLELQETSEKYQVMSSYEFGVTEIKTARQSKSKKGAAPVGKTVISNSLAVRRYWIDTYGGMGTLPSPVRSGKKGSSTAKVVEEDEVLLYAQDYVSPSFWERASKF